MQCGCGTVIVDRADEGDAYGILTFQEIVYGGRREITLSAAHPHR